MLDTTSRPPRRILIASANPLFSQGLRRQLAERWSAPLPEMRLVNSMAETLAALKEWLPELVIVDYDDRTINRGEFLNHFVDGADPMQVMLVSLQASGEVVVFDRRTLTTDQASDWFSQGSAQVFPSSNGRSHPAKKPAARAERSQLLSMRWILTTLVVLAVAALFIRLGFWQLDRLSQRRAHNALVRAQAAMPALNLNQSLPLDEPEDLQYRSVIVTGEYLPGDEVLLANRKWDNQLGAHLLTPLKIDGSPYAILVDRGWVPLEEAALPERLQFAEPGKVTVQGRLQLTQQQPALMGGSTVNAAQSGRRDAWNFIDIGSIDAQSQSDLLPVYLVAAPQGDTQALPVRSLPDLELSEGSHLGYAAQWFAFAAIALIGYPFFVRRQLQSRGGADQKTE